MAHASEPVALPSRRASIRSSQHTTTKVYDTFPGRGRRIEKTPSRARGCTKPGKANSTTRRRFERHVIEYGEEARDLTAVLPGSQPSFPKVPRTATHLHACSDLSLHFVTLAKLSTTPDTNTIALNLMDYFLFDSSHWLPELSYCRLHAACFLFASLATAQFNTSEQIAASLAPETLFVAAMAAPLAVDEEAAVAIQEAIGVRIEDVEVGYGLLFERREELGGVIGEYGLGGLPEPGILFGRGEVQEQVWRVEQLQPEEKEDFDVFEEQ